MLHKSLNENNSTTKISRIGSLSTSNFWKKSLKPSNLKQHDLFYFSHNRIFVVYQIDIFFKGNRIHINGSLLNVKINSVKSVTAVTGYFVNVNGEIKGLEHNIN